MRTLAVTLLLVLGSLLIAPGWVATAPDLIDKMKEYYFICGAVGMCLLSGAVYWL